MFDFLDMISNYESRAIDRYEDDSLIIDTCSVTDANQPYETGICHPAYNNGDWVIVEMYDTREEAQAGHDRWVKTMTMKDLPKALRDCGSATIAQLVDIACPGDEDW